MRFLSMSKTEWVVIAVILAVLIALVPPTPHWSELMYESCDLCGNCRATVQFACHAAHVHVIGLAVHPDHQRSGIGRSMIDWIAARAPSLGHHVVALDTIRETGNVALFEKMGFHVVRQNVATWCTSEDYPKVHDVLMERIVA